MILVFLFPLSSSYSIICRPSVDLLRMGACRLSAKKVVCRQALKNLAKKLLGSFLLSICSRITTFKSSIPLPRRCQPGFLISTCAHGFSPFLFGSKQTLVIPAELWCRLPEAVHNQSIAALPQKPSVARLSSPIANEGWSFTRGKDSPRVKVAPKRDAALYGFLMSVCTKSKELLSSHAWSDIKFISSWVFSWVCWSAWHLLAQRDCQLIYQ